MKKEFTNTKSSIKNTRTKPSLSLSQFHSDKKNKYQLYRTTHTHKNSKFPTIFTFNPVIQRRKPYLVIEFLKRNPNYEINFSGLNP